MVHIVKYLLSFFLVCIGIIIGIAIHHYHNMPLIETINIVDVATLITTIFLAVYIPEVLDRKMQTKHEKKELIDKRLDELQSLYRDLNMIVQQDSISRKDYLTIKNTLDICKHRLDTVTTLLEFANMKTSFTEDIKCLKRLCNEHEKLLRYEEMGNEGFEYPDNIRAKEESIYNKIYKEICLLVFKISEA